MANKYSQIRKLCLKSPLALVQDAYEDMTQWESNPTDEQFIKEIEWKLECAIANYDEGCDDSYTRRDFTYTEKFLIKLKRLQQRK